MRLRKRCIGKKSHTADKYCSKAEFSTVLPLSLTITHAYEHAQKACPAGTFQLIALARRQPCFALCVQNCTAIRVFWVGEFSRTGFLSLRGKTAVNPFGLTRILTKQRRKYCRENRVRTRALWLHRRVFQNPFCRRCEREKLRFFICQFPPPFLCNAIIPTAASLAAFLFIRSHKTV